MPFTLGFAGLTRHLKTAGIHVPLPSGHAAEIDVGGVIKRVDRVFLEFARYPDGERQAVMLSGVAQRRCASGGRHSRPASLVRDLPFRIDSHAAG
jgi:hypothetical protein